MFEDSHRDKGDVMLCSWVAAHRRPRRFVHIFAFFDFSTKTCWNFLTGWHGFEPTNTFCALVSAHIVTWWDVLLRYILYTCPNQNPEFTKDLKGPVQKLGTLFWCWEESSLRDSDKRRFSPTQVMLGCGKVIIMCVFTRKMLTLILCVYDILRWLSLQNTTAIYAPGTM